VANIEFNTDQKTVQDIINHYKNRHLNLHPGFQRDSVWRDRDRKHLIDSVVSWGSGLWILVFRSIKPSNNRERASLRLLLDLHQSETDLAI